MQKFRGRISPVSLWLGGALSVAPVLAAGCADSGSFESWLEKFKREAIAKGVSQSTVNSAFQGVSFDPGIVSRDRGQKVFRQSFEQFSARMVAPYRLKRGAGLIKKYGETFRRIEHQFGVPPP